MIPTIGQSSASAYIKYLILQRIAEPTSLNVNRVSGLKIETDFCFVGGIPVRRFVFTDRQQHFPAQEKKVMVNVICR